MTSTDTSPTRTGLLGAVAREISLIVSLVTVVIFYFFGERLAAQIAHPVWLAVVFFWLFAVLFWAATSVMRHADSLAARFGEPYGTLLLTLAAISIEIVTISAAMLHGDNNPTLARDMMFAVIMIALNGLVGLCLLLGGLSHREQYYNLQGANTYLATIIALAVLGLVLPNYTTSVNGPRLSIAQEIFVVITSIGLYGVFLLIQTTRHRDYFVLSQQTNSGTSLLHHPPSHSAIYHTILMFFYLGAVVYLAEQMALPLDNSIERFGMPQALGGAIVAALVLAPEALAAIRASLSNQLQRSVNILHGSVLATIGLTIPAVLIIGQTTHRPVTLGVEGGNLPLLLLTLTLSVVTFISGRTNVLQGCIHLLLMAVFVLLIFSP